jgi:hypothetical protein
MIKQRPLILLTPVKADRINALTELLSKIKTAMQAGTESEFKKLNTVHYARWVILDRDSFRDEPAIAVPPRLIFSSNYDGNEDDHLDDFVTVLEKYIDQVYECCEGYPEPAARTMESRKNYLKQWRIDTSAFYVGAPGRSLKQIEQENNLRNHVWSYVTKNNWDGKSAREIHHAIQKEVDSKPEFAWSKQKIKVPGIQWLPLIAYGLLIIAVLPLMIIWILYIFLFHELRDKYKPTTPSQIPDSLVSNLEKDEDLFPQNQFTQVVVMKPGIVRQLNFRIWMLRTRVLASFMFVKGKLLNIPTIHFARWVLFDDKKHVLFFSNFDGSWQQYLGDFIDQSGWGLSGIFSNTVNFPTTRFMVTGGAYDEEHFLAWSRSTQIPTNVWYAAYPHLSIKNIINNTKIRNELRDKLSEKQAQLFLKRI